MSVCMYVSMYVCLYVCMYVYLYIISAYKAKEYEPLL